MVTTFPCGSVDLMEFLDYARARGVVFRMTEGQLRYIAPKNALSHADLATLRGFRTEIEDMVSTQGAADRREGASHVGQLIGMAPLSYTQLQHWNIYQLDQRHSSRFTVSAVRLRGRLRLSALRESVSFLIERHEVLRARIVQRNGQPMQRVCGVPSEVVNYQQFSQMPPEHRIEALNREIEEIVSAPIDVTRDRLYEVALVERENDDHVLVLATEHMVSDMRSLDLFFEELPSVYGCIKRGVAPMLPKMSLQFADYAAWQRSTERELLDKHEKYWKDHLYSCVRIRFPCGRIASDAREAGWGVSTVRVAQKLRVALGKCARALGTTSVMCAYAAYAALVLRWCDVSEGVVQFMTDGRRQSAVENTFGFFASPLHLRMSLRAGDRAVDIIRRAVSEYCEAYEHADLSYLEAKRGDLGFTRNSVFNWIPSPQFSGSHDAGVRVGGLSITAEALSQPILRSLKRDSEPFIVVVDSGTEAIGRVFYPLALHAERSMSAFSRSFLKFLDCMVRDPNVSMSSISIIRDRA